MLVVRDVLPALLRPAMYAGLQLPDETVPQWHARAVVEYLNQKERFRDHLRSRM